MEQLVIFLLFVVASIISSVIQKKKKADEQAAGRGLTAGPRPTVPPPANRWPQTARDWQEQLRKMLQENAPPVAQKPVQPSGKSAIPPITRPVAAKVSSSREKSEGELELKSPLRESTTAYERGLTLRQKVEQRFRAVDQQTVSHKPTLPSPGRDPAGSPFVRRLRHRPAALREAFIGSIILEPPKSLQEPV